MAGHRRQDDGTLQPKRSIRRARAWRALLAAAPDSETYFDTAYRWYRAEVSHISDPAGRTAALNEAAEYLATRADDLAKEHAA